MNTSEECFQEKNAIAATVAWLEQIVIGLNLCPFANAVHVRNRIRFVVSPARKSDALLDDLKRELELLVVADPQQMESTLLIHPHVLNDFFEYNDFLAVCDLALAELELEGIVQVASFHPQYQFAGTKCDDVTNFTNRSPYPILHLLREESVSQAVDTFPDVAGIFQKNMATLRKIGKTKMASMLAGTKLTAASQSTQNPQRSARDCTHEKPEKTE